MWFERNQAGWSTLTHISHQFRRSRLMGCVWPSFDLEMGLPGVAEGQWREERTGFRADGERSGRLGECLGHEKLVPKQA